MSGLTRIADRVPIVCSANALQPNGQNDNGWDQGLMFLDPAQAWLQPPAYVTQMISRNRQPQVVAADLSGDTSGLDVTATRSADGATLGEDWGIVNDIASELFGNKAQSPAGA